MNCVYCQRPTRRGFRVRVGRDHPYIPGGLASHLGCGPRGRFGWIRIRTIVRYYRAD